MRLPVITIPNNVVLLVEEERRRPGAIAENARRLQSRIAAEAARCPAFRKPSRKKLRHRRG